MILHYIHYLQPIKKCHQDKRLCVVVNVVYIPKLYIPHYYHGVISIFKTQGSNPKFSKQKIWRKRIFAYMKHIKIRSCHMGIIFTPTHMTRQRQQCVRIHSQVMHYQTGNVSWDVVPNFQVLIFLTKKHMINILERDLQFYFTCIIYANLLFHQTFCFENFGFDPWVF